MGKKKRNKQKDRKKSKIIVRRGGVDTVKTVPANQGKVFGQNQVQTVKGTPVNNLPATVPAARTTVPVAGRATTVVAKQPTFWETDVETKTVTKCGLRGAAVDVTIKTKASDKMDFLMRKFTRIEWLAYLVGDKETNTIEDIVIPKQRVTSVRVDVDEPVSVPIIGVIHSHHDMGNNFSGTDDEYINGNHDISLCISHTGIKGHVRVKTECGCFLLVDAKVTRETPEFDDADFIKEVDDNITEQRYTYPAYNNYGAGGNVHGRGAAYPTHYGEYGNRAGWEDFEDECWDTDPTSAAMQAIDNEPAVQRELLECIRNYRESIKGVEVDDYYLVEFTMLVHLIRSIGGPHYEMWETKAFDDNDSNYTEQYYHLIDEISNFNDELTVSERQAINLLATDLDKKIEVSSVQ